MLQMEHTARQEMLSFLTFKRAGERQDACFAHMFEVYVDNFMQLAQSRDPEVL